MNRKGLLLAVGLSACVATSVRAFPTPEGIYSNIPGFFDSVPGQPGLVFNAGTGSQFGRPFRSPDGSRWIFSALMESPAVTADDEVVIVGMGLSGTTVAREGISNIEAGRVCESASIDERVSINDAGKYAFTCNLSGATTDDEVIVTGSAGINTVALREGGSMAPALGFNYGTTLDSPTIHNDGSISIRTTTIAGTPAGQTQAGLINSNLSLAYQSGVTPVAGSTWSTTGVGAGDFYVSENGASWMGWGDTNGATTSDAILAVNNVVMLQEGVSPGGGMAGMTSIAEAIGGWSGSWMARGATTGGDDFLVHDGSLVAKTNDLVPGGLPGEFYTDDQPSDPSFTGTFFSMAVNNVGGYAFGVVTSNPDLTRNAVYVYSDGITSSVVLREGDWVDLNRNGIQDEDVFLSVFNNEDVFLTDDGYMYFMADLENAAGTSIGQAFLRVVVPEPATLSLLAVAAAGLLRRRSR